MPKGFDLSDLPEWAPYAVGGVGILAVYLLLIRDQAAPVIAGQPYAVAGPPGSAGASGIAADLEDVMNPSNGDGPPSGDNTNGDSTIFPILISEDPSGDKIYDLGNGFGREIHRPGQPPEEGLLSGDLTIGGIEAPGPGTYTEPVGGFFGNLLFGGDDLPTPRGDATALVG